MRGGPSPHTSGNTSSTDSFILPFHVHEKTHGSPLAVDGESQVGEHQPAPRARYGVQLPSREIKDLESLTKTHENITR